MRNDECQPSWLAFFFETRMTTNDTQMKPECSARRGHWWPFVDILFHSCFAKRCLAAWISAILLPSAAWGHGSTFLIAKLEMRPEARAVLEISADHGQNPMIANEAEARAALLKCLHLREKGDFRPLDENAANWSTGKKWRELAPESILPSADDEDAHKLLTAKWEFECVDPSLVFQAPKGSLQDVLLWMPAEPGESPKWMMLLGGDVSREIAVLPREKSIWPPVVAVVVLLTLGSLWRVRRRQIQS